MNLRPINLIAAASMLVTFQAHAQHQHTRESVEVANHTVFNSDTVVKGVTVLVRDYRDQLITASVTNHDLVPGAAYSIWWAVFNFPRYCAEPYRCTVRDLEVFGGDPRIRASVFWGGGVVADSTGAGTTELRLTRGRTTRETFARSKPYGLLNLRGSEIHVVLRWHDEAMPGSLAQQVGTANEACPPDDCQNVFASTHVPARFRDR